MRTKLIKAKKGFTLIELIVVMAVIAILVLLAAPRFLGMTQKAELTKIKNDIKVVENAAMLYHVHNEDWPRLSDVPYTAEELTAYAETYRDKTGEPFNIDPEGKYYSIDWEKLKPYVKTPKNPHLFILRNPVGEVFYMQNLTPAGEAFVAALMGEAVDAPETPEAPATNPYLFDYIIGFVENLETGEVEYSGEIAALDRDGLPKSIVIPSHTPIGEFYGPEDNESNIEIQTIYQYGFSEAGLESVVLPSTLVLIDTDAFYFNNLTSISLPQGLKYIMDGAFAMNNLTEVTIPEGVMMIGAYAFAENPLETITLPDGIMMIFDNAFGLDCDIDYQGAGVYTLQGNTWSK